jgi:hypothetical protein
VLEVPEFIYVWATLSIADLGKAAVVVPSWNDPSTPIFFTAERTAERTNPARPVLFEPRRPGVGTREHSPPTSRSYCATLLSEKPGGIQSAIHECHIFVIGDQTPFVTLHP